MNPYALAADALVFFHSLYVLFTVGGAVLILAGAVSGWRWIRRRVFRILHLAAVLLVALEASLGVLCPLTVWEYELRRAAGQRVEEDISFVGRILRELIFVELPDWGFLLLYLGFGLVMVILVFLIPWEPSRKGRKGPEDPSD
jgi:hypothetical protein